MVRTDAHTWAAMEHPNWWQATRGYRQARMLLCSVQNCSCGPLVFTIATALTLRQEINMFIFCENSHDEGAAVSHKD